MASDHEGTTVGVGDDIWIPATVTGVGTINPHQIMVQTAYGNSPLTLLDSQTHKDKKPSQFPDLP